MCVCVLICKYKYVTIPIYSKASTANRNVDVVYGIYVKRDRVEAYNTIIVTKKTKRDFTSLLNSFSR